MEYYRIISQKYIPTKKHLFIKNELYTQKELDNLGYEVPPTYHERIEAPAQATITAFGARFISPLYNEALKLAYDYKYNDLPYTDLQAIAQAYGVTHNGARDENKILDYVDKILKKGGV